MIGKKINWTALEYEHKEKKPDWFWALGIVAVASSVASIIYKNYFFAILIILAMVMLAFLNLRKPQEVEIELNEKGIRVEDFFYPYKNLKSFYVHHGKLLVHSNRAFMPIITLPISDNVSEKEIGEFLKKYLKEEEMAESFTAKLIEVLGF